MQRLMFDLPFMIGSNYFMWGDEPALGISPTFPEDGSYGLVNKDDRPYKELVDMFSALNKQVYELHARSQTDDASTCKRQSERPLPVKSGEVKYWRKGNAFKINNGALSIEYDGTSGNFADRIKLKGHLLGYYNPMVRQYSDHDYWTMTDKVEKISFKREGKILVVDLVGSGGGSGNDIRFEIAHRWRITPGTPWFESSIMWVKNGSNSKIIRIKSLFISLYSSLSGSQKDDKVYGKPLRYYYKNGRMACWIEEKSKLRFGIAAAKYGRYDYIDGQGLLKIQYYIDHKGVQHPDARIVLDPLLELLPNRRFLLKPIRKFLIFGAEKEEWSEIKESLEKWSSI